MSKLRNFGMITKSEYIGKTLEDAKSHAKSGGFTTRIVEQNGIALMLDMSVMNDRVNFRVVGDVVTDVFTG